MRASVESGFAQLRKDSQLDSIEKLRVIKFYGNKTIFENVLNEKPLVVIKKEPDINDMIEAFFARSGNIESDPQPMDLAALKKISNYLSEFHQAPVGKPKPTAQKKYHTIKKHIKCISWKNQLKTESISKKAYKRRMEKTNSDWVGTGNYLPYEGAREKTKQDEGFGVGCRFVEGQISSNPGPGTYGNDDNLHRPEKMMKKPTTLLPSFEWCGTRRGVDLNTLPPTLYTWNRDTITGTVERKISKRGPYDLFTGPRDGTTVKNHFSRPNPPDVKSWPANFPGMSELNKRRGGQWGTCKRDISSLVDPWRPAPNTYQEHVMNPKEFQQLRHPFNCSVEYIWSSPLKTLPYPGPGRYFPCAATVKRSKKYQKTLENKLKKSMEAKKSVTNAL